MFQVIREGAMADRCSLKERLQESTEDLEATIKMVLNFISIAFFIIF